MKQARHPKAKLFHDSGLFAGIKSFSQLEDRIAALPDKNSKGAAFEVFTEACLATQKIYQASEVWPGNCVPTELRALKLGACRTEERGLVVYFQKFDKAREFFFRRFQRCLLMSTEGF